MENKEELSKAVNDLENDYDAFYMMNRYSWESNTHAKEFEMLAKLKDDKVPRALAWIHDYYDCYYKDENTEDSPFNYLRVVISNEM